MCHTHTHKHTCMYMYVVNVVNTKSDINVSNPFHTIRLYDYYLNI